MATQTSIIGTATNHTGVVSGGDVVTITVNLSEPVTVAGVPALLLNDSEAALYAGGSGTSTLTFEYPVQPNDSTPDLTVAGLYLPTGASIQDVANRPLSTIVGDLGLQVHASTPSNATVNYSFTNYADNNAALVGQGVGAAQINNDGQLLISVSGFLIDVSVVIENFIYNNGILPPLPNYISASLSARAVAINNSDVVVGNDGGGGFLVSNGASITLADPSAIVGTFNSTAVAAINDNDQVVGAYVDATGSHGFIYNNGSYTTLDDPFAISGTSSSATNGTSATAINNSGQVVGDFTDATNTEHGFLYSNGTYLTLTDPLATTHNGDGTSAVAINNSGQVVGNYVAGGGEHGFLYTNGNFISIDDPNGQPGTTSVVGINNIGEIIGNSLSSNGIEQGFIFSGGAYTHISDPLGIGGTVLKSINDLGQLAGYYMNSQAAPYPQQVFEANAPAPQATTIQQEIAGLYAAVYNRAADSFGMQYWVNVVAQQADALDITYSAAANTPISTNDSALLGQLFVATQSAFFNQTYGSLNDADFVNALYFNIGGQNAESSSAIAYWVNIIQNGEASGLSAQNARAAMVGQFVHDLIDVNLAQWTTILTPSELEQTILRQAVVDNKLAVSLAYVNASAGLGGSILNAHAVGDAGFQAEVTALNGVAIDPFTATVQIAGINQAVADHNLADIHPA